ncbi:MAG: bifunctional adenosylcobinamide kinase/adenosylcobinamide-phosphate guanylyltransferase [Muricoprocola sp.]
MDLVIGGAFQGKKGVACDIFRMSEEQVTDGDACQFQDIFQSKAMAGFHLFIRRFLKEGLIDEQFPEKLYEKNPGIVIISDEIGYGIVPLDAEERHWREQTGRICCQLAVKAENVIRVVAGLPVYIKRAPMKIYLIRHGQTSGNLLKRYIGVTDEPLCREGIENIQSKKEQYTFLPQRLYVSPMKRCRETAQILFEGMEQVIVEDLRECDFGTFENKNYLELEGNPAYQEWIDSNATLPFPQGESKEDFQKRCVDAFDQILEEARQKQYHAIALVIHGGTIMSILEKYGVPKKKYYEFSVENGCGYVLTESESGYRYSGLGAKEEK